MCPTNEQCCLASRWKENLVNIAAKTEQPYGGGYPKMDFTSKYNLGNCIDPRYQACCDEGSIFIKSKQRCCLLTGIQEIDTPCPCTKPEHCRHIVEDTWA
eukprot:504475_1